MSKHTPGPWFFTPFEGTMARGYVGIVGAPQHPLCEVKNTADKCGLANAALIAEAPTLLEACEAVASMAGKCLLGDGNYREASAEAFNQAADLVRSAIARAKGAK